MHWRSTHLPLSRLNFIILMSITILTLLSTVATFLLSRYSDQVGKLMLLPLEHRFGPSKITTPQKFAGVIVLTGDKARISEAGRLARLYPAFKVVISGTKDMPGAQAVLGPGIEASRVFLEGRSTNTYENALYSAEILSSTPNARWLLVTGAYHMPRAIGAFRQVGLEVEPWPICDLCGYKTGLLHQALHEWVALFIYRLLGKTSSLFPGPRD